MNQPPPDDRTAMGEGTTADLSDPQRRRWAVEAAFDYRGDVTVQTRDGRTIEGYVFDRCPDGSTPYVRLIASDGSGHHRIDYDDIERLSFTGRDTAAGKSWETWVRQYIEKQSGGEPASREPDSST